MSHAEATQIKRIKPIKRHVSGVLLLNKPYGITSNRALQIAKQLFSAAKVGHTGTLDPMATGLLPICFGEATKFSSVLLNADKTYQATLKLGYISTTGDAEGEISQIKVVNLNDKILTTDKIEQVFKDFLGKIMQLPPMYSALKHQGKPLYTYAREGVDIKRKPREIIIYDLKVVSFIGEELVIAVRCGTGTYVRTLAEDIGKALGCGGAYLTALCRSSIGYFDLTKAQDLVLLEDMQMTERDGNLYPVDSILNDYPAIELDCMAAVYLMQGRRISNYPAATGYPEGEVVRLYDHEQCFLGIGEVFAEGNIIPKRLMVTN
jgi:tRNA pseudouridine55 synthase